jgi:hypothetical protein
MPLARVKILAARRPQPQAHGMRTVLTWRTSVAILFGKESSRPRRKSATSTCSLMMFSLVRSTHAATGPVGSSSPVNAFRFGVNWHRTDPLLRSSPIEFFEIEFKDACREGRQEGPSPRNYPPPGSHDARSMTLGAPIICALNRPN